VKVKKGSQPKYQYIEGMVMLVQDVEKIFKENMNLFKMDEINFKKNKGSRGQRLESRLGLPLSSNLKDLDDGEIKSYTLGETIKITHIKHLLDEIIFGNVDFRDSKVYEKIKTTIFIGYSKQKKFIYWETLRLEDHINVKILRMLEEDFNYICSEIRKRYHSGSKLNTITGPNKFLKIKTSDSARADGSYNPIHFQGKMLKDKNMAFHFSEKFGKIWRNI